MKNKKITKSNICNFSLFKSIRSFPRFENKSGMALSIVLLVIFVILIIGVTIGYFVSSEKKLTFTYQMPAEIDYVNNDMLRLDFELQELFDKTTKDLTPGSRNENFIEKYNDNLVNYNPVTISRYKNQIIKQLNITNIVITSDKISLIMNIVLTNNRTDNGLKVTYDYHKEFVKDISRG